MKRNSPSRRRGYRPLLPVAIALSAGAALVVALLSPSAVIGLPHLSVEQHNHSAPAPAPAPTPPPPAPTNEKTPAAILGKLPLPPDQTAGPMDVYARRLQDIDKIFITVRLHLPGRYTVEAEVSVPGSKPATYAFKPVSRTVPPHLKTKVLLRLSDSSRAAVKEALRAGKRLVVSVDVNAWRPGAAQASARAKRSVQLRLEGTGSVQGRLRDVLDLLLALISGDVKPTSLRGQQGPQGAPGEQGDPGRSALTELQPGETERGTIGGQTAVPLDTEVAYSATLPIPAAFGLDDEHVTVDGNPDDEAADECKGSADDPQADPGYVCIYPFTQYNAREARGFIWGASQDGKSKWGFQVSWFATADPPNNTGFFANWAYTAPGEAPVSTGHHH